MFTPRTDVVSRLMRFDIAHQSAALVAEFDGRYEAPNWLPDDSGVLINGGGRLWRVPFDDPALHAIDTGFATKMNNDHGPSPDGRRLAICDKTETGQSVIYTLPLGGGQPERVTPLEGSYFHAWSPDGARMAYTARRDGRFRIATAQADGSDERILSDPGFDHCDGPDYSPDGAWIWFNGERDGAVDIWRLPVGGGPAERMTQGPTVDWFPHPSPDDTHVVYMAYAPGTLQHPPDVDVSLMLMPASGGTPRQIHDLWGGQGTLNVPCWAPDSRAFAFMEYRVR